MARASHRARGRRTSEAELSRRWLERNRMELSAEMSALRRIIDTFAGRDASAPDDDAALSSDPDFAGPLDHLCAVFELGDRERAVLLLCAGVELDRDFAESCAAAQGAKDATRPTIGLALSLFGDADWSLFAPFAPLRHAGLITVTPGAEIVQSTLALDEALLHYLLDGVLLDAELLTLFAPLPAEPEIDAPFADAVAERWRSADVRRVPLRLESASSAERLEAVSLIAAAASGPAYRIDASALPAATGLFAFARRWRRFHLLHGAVAVVDIDGVPAEALRLAEQFVEALGAPAIVVGEASRPLDLTDMMLAAAPASTTERRIAAWRAVLADAGGRKVPDEDLAELADRFRLPLRAMRAIARGTAGVRPARRPAALIEGCRTYGRTRLEKLADCIAPSAGWARLVLPHDVEGTLHELVAQVRHRDLVRRRWGVGGGSDRGLSATALFAGASGTGKTLAAEVIAAELRLDLYRIDLSNVVSKYIGETEKHLARLFDAAEGSGAVLLFDEADALFGKRSEVKDSHDRYANIEVGYLLQRLERYNGIAILTTNLREAIDPAFLRRLRFVVDFPFPDEAARARLWDLWLPAGRPRGSIDPLALARVPLTGGQIFNVAVNAAFLAAAAADQRITPDQILTAVRREFAKAGRALGEGEARAIAPGVKAAA